MRIKNLTVKNFKGIEELNVSFNEGVNLIIGNNGAGKSSLLRALSVILCEPLRLIRNVGNLNYIDSDVRITTRSIGDASVNTTSNYPAEVKAQFDFSGEDYSCAIRRINEVSNEEFGDTSLWETFKDSFNSDNIAPLICYMCTGRTIITEGWNNISIPTGETERAQGYFNSLARHFEFDMIQQWCLKMEFAEYQRKSEIREYTEFKSIIAAFMKKIDKMASDPKIYYSSNAGALVYSDGKDDRAFDLLSAGYKSVLCMIVELAYRAVILNPLTDDLNNKLTGVVIIDEIDDHLHPAWQWKILPALQKTFPKIQFIIATHSPIVLSSAKGSTLMLMKTPNEIETIQSVYGYSVDDVLSLPQGTAEAPEEVTVYFDKAEAILDSGSEAELDMLLRDAEEEFRDYPDIFRKLKEFIDINKWIEEA